MRREEGSNERRQGQMADDECKNFCTHRIEKVSIEPKEAGHDQSNSAAITTIKEQIRIIIFFGERENINSNDYA